MKDQLSFAEIWIAAGTATDTSCPAIASSLDNFKFQASHEALKDELKDYLQLPRSLKPPTAEAPFRVTNGAPLPRYSSAESGSLLFSGHLSGHRGTCTPLTICHHV
jgi:hypothetical protein